MHTNEATPGEEKQVSLVLNTVSNDIMVTAVLNVLDKDQQPIHCRALLDTCSTTNFMTQSMARLLKLKTSTCRVPVGALNAMTTYCNEITTATITSRVNKYKKTLTFLIIPMISQIVPDQPIHQETLKIPSNIKLADPLFYKPAPIDLLIGAGTTLSLLCIGQIKISLPAQQELFLQKTLLGWIIGGAAPSSKYVKPAACHVTNINDFDLNKFWEIEECPSSKRFTPEEEECEQHFQKHITRDPTGRYVVALPFNPRIPALGDSYHLALKRLINTEQKLKRNPSLKTQYHQVIQEYLDLNHMSLIHDQPTATTSYYLPHHAVIKETSMTTKVRVVFDGSANTTTGISLNDKLFTGPTIQSDLFSLLIRFRKHPIVLTGDIEKMYRQFLVRKEDRKFQRILWNHGNKTQSYELNTVTFGLRPAPYLAIRCLHQLAQDEGHSFPIAAKILTEDFYVDDLLTGAQTKLEAIQMRQEVSHILAKAGLIIRQWASNDSEVLKDIAKENINPHLQLGDTTLKTLGVCWESKTDSIMYTVNAITITNQTKITKRTILSEVAKIFDPLGLLAPVIIIAKILLQRLWSEKLDWDESLPLELHTEWKTYCSQLQLLNQISFPRTIMSSTIKNIQLHGFSDASEKAYGACVYLRVLDHQGKTRVQLLCAKSRVAPLKTITIPRLELCGAQLLATLITATVSAIKMTFDGIYCWTDSTIVLHWLNTSPQHLKTFVSNRVADIQNKTIIDKWHHVPTKDNPADLVSRGVLPADFLSMKIWRKGPLWLSEPQNKWPVTNLHFSKEIPEQRRFTCLFTTKREFTTFDKFSNLDRLMRSLAYCFRFVRGRQTKGPLTVKELREVEIRVIKAVQRQAFAEDLKILNKLDLSKHTNAQLSKLTPMLDDNGIMRVGGRLSFSNLPFDAKHPIILPKNNHVTNLFIRHTHRIHLHCGVQQTLYILRRKYWIIEGRSQVYKILNKCVQCCKARPPTTNYLMGNLPKPRVNPSRPFSQVGVDYCGPFILKEKKFRNRAQIKSYVAVFVCLAVKAVHLELITDLTSEGFLSALRRFVSRRGLCQDIYSDNGTNFVGANNILRELTDELSTAEAQEKIQGYLTTKGIQWHFIPPQAPHVGGLWEAAVKSFKRLLQHVAGHEMLFTYEQFNTLVIEIEAILNSRPLTPISSDSNDPLVLTPGHFLIGDSLTNLRGHDFTDIPTNRLSTWEHIQKVKQDFWKRWSLEYLNELTRRTKWDKPEPNITQGAVVLLRDDNSPPAQWVMGQVIECYPGDDGIIRTVKVKTSRNTFVRNIKKLAILPVCDDSNQS
ncbi:uncharacterized protein LOC130674197 [Microplitis mediator]|uniref:uncharacterized protein LOC130674197 n=1 Tax=Microplitis mediator TaxID=375433 RepID=UPI002555B7B8|nr:uncharacterized protein LOC130674197 [Microplitis mediator]